jgi:transcriptional regulator with GAF, ATPase, and Fis domain
MAQEPTRYRLRGEVAGLVRGFALAPGSHRVGSTSECDIVLPVRGVSRRHAVVRVSEEGVTVEDDGSRNGTFVAGVPVRRAAVAPGDEIRFGPVALRLETLDAQDAELALELSTPAAPLSHGLSGIETATCDARAPQPDRSCDGLVFPPGYVPGDSPAMASLHAQLRPLVKGDLPVLLLGETGVGKECIARALHLSSPRHAGPFVAVNCAAIPADLLESEMFGIAKAVATGVAERAGRFQLASGGTLFLDEIGEMPAPLQAKLLRALQQNEVQPVGGPPVAVDIRVVAATNSELRQRMEEGAFRRDLYYRVAGYALLVPALRERREDIPALVESFVRVFVRETGKPVRGLTVRALHALVSYAWPGNVRELQHEVRRLVYLCPDGEPIDSTMLSEPVRAVLGTAEEAPDPPRAGLPLDRQVEQLERRLIREALARAGGNRSEAARRLGISRNGLALKMERLGLLD